MAEVVYIFCALISVVCVILLIASYRKTEARILLWVAVCFVFLAANNIFVCFDLIFFPDIEMAGSVVRNTLLASAGSSLMVGLIWELS